MAVQLVGEIHGWAYICRIQDWPIHEHDCTRPYSAHLFLEKAGSLHRKFASLFLASFLKPVAACHVPLTAAQRGFFLYFWLGGLLDFNADALGYYSTGILGCLPEFSEAFDGTNWQQKLMDGPLGHGTRDVIVAVLQKLVHLEKSVTTVSFITKRLYHVQTNFVLEWDLKFLSRS